MKRLLSLAFLLITAGGIASAQPRGAAVQNTLIRNATVLTVSHGTLPNTDVLIRNGKIAAIGKDLKGPRGRAGN